MPVCGCKTFVLQQDLRGPNTPYLSSLVLFEPAPIFWGQDFKRADCKFFTLASHLVAHHLFGNKDFIWWWPRVLRDALGQLGNHQSVY